jgi:hypothetical protein
MQVAENQRIKSEIDPTRQDGISPEAAEDSTVSFNNHRSSSSQGQDGEFVSPSDQNAQDGISQQIEEEEPESNEPIHHGEATPEADGDSKEEEEDITNAAVQEKKRIRKAREMIESSHQK